MSKIVSQTDQKKKREDNIISGMRKVISVYNIQVLKVQ